MFEPFQLPFVQRGLIEVLILAVSRPALLGTWIVLRGLAFFSHAVGTAAFPGLVLADGLGFAAPLGAFGAAVAFSPAPRCSAAATRSGATAPSRSSSSAASPPGVILASDVFGSGANVETLLFGSLLLVDGGDIALAARRRRGDPGRLAAARPALARGGLRPEAAGPACAPAAWLDVVLLGLIALATTAALSRGRRPAGRRALRRAGAHRPALRRADARPGSSPASPWSRVEGTVGLWLSVKTDAPPGATIACSRGGLRPRRRRPGHWRGRRAAGARRGRRCAGGAARRRLRRRARTPRRGSSRWSRRRPRSATSSARSAATRSPSTRSCSRTPTRTSTSRGPSDVAGAADAKLVFANGDDLDDWIGRGRLRQRQRRRRSSTSARPCRCGCPASRAGRRPRGMTRTGGTTRATPRPRCARSSAGSRAADPAHKARLRAQRRAPTWPKLRALDRGIARCIDSVPAAAASWSPTTTPSATSPSRYGIDVVGAVIPSQTTQAQPSAKDLSAARRADRARARQGDLPRELAEPEGGRGDRRQTGASADYTLYGDTLGPDGSTAPPTWRWRRPTPTRWSRGFTGGTAARCRSSCPDRGRRGSPPATAAAPAISGVELLACAAGQTRWRCSAPTAAARRRCCGRCSASCGRWRGRCASRRAAPPCPRPSARGSTTRSPRSTWRRWGRSRGCPGGGGRAAREREAAAAALDAGRPRRARRGDLRRALRRPAPAGADRPRPGPGRRGAAARRALLRPRPAQRRGAGSADRASWPGRGGGSSSPPTTSSRRARCDLVLCINRRQIACGAPDAGARRRRGARSDLRRRDRRDPRRRPRAILPPHHHHH